MELWKIFALSGAAIVVITCFLLVLAAAMRSSQISREEERDNEVMREQVERMRERLPR